MTVIPLFWQGTTRKHRLLEILKSRFDAWLPAWNANATMPTGIQMAKDEDAPAASVSEVWYGFGAKAPGIALRTHRDAEARLGCALVGLRQPDSHSLATGIGRRAICDLVCSLLQIKGDGVQVEAIHKPDRVAIDARHGVFAFDCLIGGITLRFHLDGDACRSLLPHVVPVDATRLASRRQAVMPASTKLRAMLDLGELTVQEGISLRPGEILKTGLRLDSPVRLETEQGRTAFTGVLKAVDGNRAVQCTTPPETQGI